VPAQANESGGDAGGACRVVPVLGCRESGLPIPPSSVNIIRQLIRELRQFRARYAELLERMKDPDWEDSVDDRTGFEYDYHSWFVQWETDELEGDVDDPGNELRIQFIQTIAPFWDVMNRIKEALIVLAATSELGRAARGAFDELPFVQNLDHSIRYKPFRTLAGIDAVIALLQEVSSDAGPLSEQPITKPLAVKDENAQTLRVTSYNDSSASMQVRGQKPKKRALLFDPKLLKKAKEKRRHKNTDVLNFFGIQDESTVSKWLAGSQGMSPENAKRYDKYVSVLTPEERKLP